jgi:hypothetical protein
MSDMSAQPSSAEARPKEFAPQSSDPSKGSRHLAAIRSARQRAAAVRRCKDRKRAGLGVLRKRRSLTRS